jgi:menaquinone-dependent protoporphyrinogen oxidase
MKRIAVLYGTTEGQTAKIAQHIAELGRRRGHRIDVRHIAELEDDFDPRRFDGVIVGASIHEGHHQRYVVRWVSRHAAALSSVPNSAFTVCLAIRSAYPKERDEALAYSRLYAERAGWKPTVSAVFAGALRYTQYNWLVRMLVKQIARHEGGSTETAHDTEYTDWAEVDRFANELYDRVESAAVPG